MIFVSYYTGKPYQICSDRLRLSLIKHKLQHHIVGKDNQGHKQLNISGKPQFVKECLLRFRQPICWVDADSEVIKYPELLFRDEDKTHLQIYNWLADADNHITRTNNIQKFLNFITDSQTTSPDKLLSSSGTFAFNYSKESLELLDKWIQKMKENPKIPDDQVLDKVFNEGGYINKIKCRWLPKSYNRMVRFSDWMNTEPVINNTETDMCEIKR